MKRNFIWIFLFFSEVVKSQLLFYVRKDTMMVFQYEWGDEFENENLSTDKWSTNYGWGNTIPHNGELQFYTRTGNFFLRNGLLYLTAIRKDTLALCYDWKKPQDSLFHNGNFIGMNQRVFPFTSGMIQSGRDFVYGYFEIFFKVKEVQGFWPAFWLYGGTPNEEIDWMELKTEFPQKISVNLHHQNSRDGYRKIGFRKRRFGGWVKMNGNFSEKFTLVSGYWSEKEISFFINGVHAGYFPNRMKVPKKLVANLAVAQDGWAFSPGPRNDFNDSLHFIIDYIRVWKPLLTDNTTPSVFSQTLVYHSEYPENLKVRPAKNISGGKKNLKRGAFICIGKNQEGKLTVLSYGNIDLQTITLEIMGKECKEILRFDKEKKIIQSSCSADAVQKITVNAGNQKKIVNIH